MRSFGPGTNEGKPEKSMRLGAHMSTRGGVWKALQRGIEVGCQVVQIFVKNNMQWFGRPFSASELKRYADEVESKRIAAVFGHAGYLINLAAPSSPKRDKSVVSLIQEIELAGALALPFLVM